MKGKYYLRGLGMGLVVAALATAAGPKQTMSDEQIKARAAELGMVEGRTYLAGSESTEQGNRETEESETESAETEPPGVEESDTESMETRQESETETGSAESPEPPPPINESVTFQVRGGDSSVSVSDRLLEAGLIEDAKAFDTFLCQNGYDKRIQAGTYQIPGNSTDRQIAEIITSGN